MDAARRLSLSVALGLLGVALILGAIDRRADVSPDAAAQLAQATAFFDSIIVRARDQQPQGPRGDELVISLGYLERLEHGLGSPFRLVDEALDDPRLADSARRRVAWALLGRLRRGDAYRIDPIVLDGLGALTDGAPDARGLDHLALIERTIERAGDPRTGELAIRLSYMVAASGGPVG